MHGRAWSVFSWLCPCFFCFAGAHFFAADSENFFFGRGSFFLQAQISRGLRGKVGAKIFAAVADFLKNFFGVFFTSARFALGFARQVGVFGRVSDLKKFRRGF